MWGSTTLNAERCTVFRGERMKKIVMGIIIAAMALGFSTAAVFAGNYKAGNKQAMSKKILVVFYSRTGNTKKIGEAIAKELNCDTEQIMDVKSRMGVSGFLRSGIEAEKERLVLIKDTKKDPSAYDMVIIGSPVWASKMSSPVRTYIAKNKDRFKRVAFFITCSSSENEPVFKGMEDLCGKKPLAVLLVTEKQIKSGEYAGKVREFVTEIGK
jgi:flavodoxin